MVFFSCSDRIERLRMWKIPKFHRTWYNITHFLLSRNYCFYSQWKWLSCFNFNMSESIFTLALQPCFVIMILECCFIAHYPMLAINYYREREYNTRRPIERTLNDHGAATSGRGSANSVYSDTSDRDFPDDLQVCELWFTYFLPM